MLFEVKDCYGNTVVCYTQRWDTHIVVGHPEMEGHEDVVKSIVATPQAVLHQNHRGSKIFYSNDPTVLKPLITAVVVSYETNRSVTTGVVTTAYSTKKLKDDKDGHLELRKI